MDKCEEYCRELWQVLRRQEDLQAQARDMYELDHSKDQIMTLLKVGLANLGMWVAAFVTLFPTGRVDHHDSERGATRRVCF